MVHLFAQERILQKFAVFHFLTASQVTRLLYSPGSARYVNALLKALVDQRYLTRQALPSDIRAGSVPYVYSLAHRGRSYLLRLGYDLSRRSSTLPTGSRSYPFLIHSLAVTDVLITASILPKYNSDIQLLDVRHDLTLKRLLHGYVVPDGFLEFRIRADLQQCFLLELDRGTESKAQMQRKLEGLLQLVQSPTAAEPSVYEQVFGTTSLTIFYAIVAQPEKRLTDIMCWTGEVLTRTGTTTERDLFRFACIPEGMLDPVWLFLMPIWRRIGATSLVPLLEV